MRIALAGLAISKSRLKISASFFAGMLFLTIAFWLSSPRAFAASALPGSNSSANNAQYVCTDNNCGALWLTNNSDAAVDQITIPSGYTEGTISVKLYGAVFTRYASSDDKYGNNVHILTEARSGSSGMTPDSDFSSITYTPVTFGGSYTLSQIYRGRGAGAASTWSTNWESGGVDAILDINAFKASATNLGNGKYERTVHVWRCYGASYQGIPSGCYSDPMKIALQDEGEEPEPGESSYSGKTTVLLNGVSKDDGWDTTSAFAEKNVSDGALNIEFGHYLRLNDSTIAKHAGDIHTNWNTYTDNPLVGGVATNQAWYGTSTTGALVNNPTTTVNLDLGHIFSVCQDLYFDKTVNYEVDAEGNVTETSRSDQDGHAKACATARYPYNFETSATAHISATDIVYAGETVNSSFVLAVNSRINPAVSTTTYATAVPSDTKVAYAQFTIPVSSGMVSGDLLTGSTGVLASSSSLCDYVRSKGFTNCLETSAVGSSLNTNVARYVPDVEPGTKYCVISGISHADSHNLPGITLDETTGLNGYALSNTNTNPTTSPYWRTSPVSCRTIAKKPSTQVWGGGVYSNGNINATTSAKTPGAALSNAPASSATKLFGSWAEYAVVNGGSSAKTVGFASAAGLGYSSSRGPVSSFCTLTHLSVANDACSGITGYSGMSGVNLDNSIVSRLKNRLTINNHTEEDTRPAGSDLSAVAYHTLPSGAQYVYVPGDANISSVLSTPSTSGFGVTRIIQVDGTLSISANVCNGGGNCSSNPASLVLSDRNSQNLSTLASVPQTIIFANNVNIDPSVTQIDAWLVVTGNVNTCNVANLSASACGRTLIINGPVITDSITLNRSGGSWAGNNSGVNLYSGNLNATALGGIAPGEIINFRADSYFWILRQITSSAEPGTAYVRELAPRY